MAVITPVWTHYELAKKALENGKHVFVEKPFTSNVSAGRRTDRTRGAQETDDHGGPHVPVHRRGPKIRELTESGALGDLYYYDSLRVNLGLFQHDVSVIWDLAPHDLSIMDHLIKGEPEAVVATGEKHLNGVEDVAFMTIYFPGNVIAHINVNWLSPVKIRTTLIGGQKKMLVWNDLVADEKIRVYDKGVQITSGEGIRDLLVSYRTGDMWAPQVEQLEALHVELDYFRRLHHEQQDSFQRWPCGIARGAHAGSRRGVHSKERRVGPPVNEFCSIAPDVKLGQGVKLSKFINLYGCEIGDETKIGAFVEIQKNATVGRRCKISSHTFVCEGVTIEDNVFIGHGVTFINDSYPRATTPDGETPDRKGLARGKDAGKTRSFDRFRIHDSFECRDWRKRDRRRGQRGDPRRASEYDCCRQSGKDFALNYHLHQR